MTLYTGTIIKLVGTYLMIRNGSASKFLFPSEQFITDIFVEHGLQQ